MYRKYQSTLLLWRMPTCDNVQYVTHCLRRGPNVVANKVASEWFYFCNLALRRRISECDRVAAFYSCFTDGDVFYDLKTQHKLGSAGVHIFLGD